ncbi:MAG: hydrolase, partial [Gammaproteobacteria bacterium]
AEEYYRLSSCRQYLKEIRLPTHIIHSRDDPFMTEAAIPQIHELSDCVTLELSDQGGHVGFVGGTIRDGIRYWLEHRIVNLLKDKTITRSP